MGRFAPYSNHTSQQHLAPLPVAFHARMQYHTMRAACNQQPVASKQLMDLLVNTEDLYASAAFGQEEVEPEWGVSELMQAQRQLRAAAVKQVEAAVLPLDRSPSFRGAYVGPHDEHGVQHTERLDTRVISNNFFRMAQQQGIVLYEPFGGMCAGLEMCLRCGLCIKRYIYSDIDVGVQRIA